MGTIIRRKPVFAALIALGCLLCGQANATSLEITPVAVHLVPGNNATTIEVMNRGGVAAAIQLRAFAWTQAGDQDVLTPTRDIIVSPPIFTIGKGATQTIRLLLRRGAASAGERTYRLLIDEVPPVSSKGHNIVVAMRLSLPVIIASEKSNAGSLHWRAKRVAGGQIMLSATNAGSAFERVHAIAVTLADGSRPGVAATGTNSYILAGARRQWVVKSGGGTSLELRLNVTTRSGKSEQVLALAQ